MTGTVDVVVAGAGPTGLTLGCELLRRGLRVRVVDRLPGPDIRSRGKGLQPRSLEVFDDLGVADAAVAAGRRHHRVRFYAGGRLAADLDLPERPPQPGVPYPDLVVLPQWRTEAILRDRLTSLGGTVEFGRAVTGVQQDADGVTVTVLDPATAGHQQLRAAYLVGCDGGRSTVRQLAGIALHGDSRTEHFVLADVRVTGLPTDGSSFAWFDGERYLAADPLSGDGTWQVQAAVAPDATGTVEPASLQLLHRLFAERGFPHVRLSDPTWLANFSPNVALAERYRNGRILLAGDAAHVHSPAGGQGMNTGIQDAYNLGWKLAAVVSGRAADALLDTYQEERMPVARSVLTGSDLGHTAVFSPAPVLTFLRDHLLVPVLRLPAVRNAILDRTSELRVGYRDSSLSAEVAPGALARLRFARGPRAGDRAPDATGRHAGAPARLFDLFRGTHFTLLVFTGVVPADLTRLAAVAREIRDAADDVHVHLVVPADQVPTGPTVPVFLDPARDAHDRYAAAAESVHLVRPDGYIAFRGQPVRARPLLEHLATMVSVPAVAR